MITKYVEKYNVAKGDITHKDQETDGLQFDASSSLSGMIITVTGSTDVVDAWVGRTESIEITEESKDLKVKAAKIKGLEDEIKRLEDLLVLAKQ